MPENCTSEECSELEDEFNSINQERYLKLESLSSRVFFQYLYNNKFKMMLVEWMKV